MWNKILIRLAVLFSSCGFVLASSAVEAQQGRSAVLTCDMVTLGKEGKGVQYRGTVENSDYQLSLVVPEGLSGWGAGPSAPFHGFTIYLDRVRPMACINFSIEQYVDLGDRPDLEAAGSRGVRLAVGNRVGIQSHISGIVNGQRFENYIVNLTVPRDGEQDIVSITFITPTQELRRTNAVFRQFLSHAHFR